MLTIELPTEADKCLDELVTETGQSKEFHVREAVLEYLSELEDVRIAEQRLADLEAGRSYTIPFEEVMKRRGMED